MAGNKTEKPTRRRLRDARRKGQAPRSGELSGALSLLTKTGYEIMTKRAKSLRLSENVATVFA